ncbi:hypothetical protein UFOVP1672_26 [uncultured Caudovirales phage]|uniref:Bacteriophage lambda, GpH, tail tape measure, C-terminal n=1 Tax=uncultured Caudovirales phage TaxID=2100421 RepID=A0A6J5Q541_9CAUD|nr:hypothetical protein UFOVP988_48 [uncultured Caudovirales phage]CAB4210869.1 hypothetical protein UFOVP1425_48 [uncultured Caudovirales phage]CAB4223350.1 hypothetical protein UFOVP1672_26 [uncultured Caudovirales phage]
MATVDTLLVRIEADLSNLKAQLDKGATSVESASKRMAGATVASEKSFERLGNVAGVAISIAAAAILKFGKDALDAAGDIAELAQQIGVTTDTFQELTFAGVQFGVTQENLSQSLAIFSRNIGQAANGSDDMLKSFRSLGVGILDANGALRSNDDILNDVVDAIAKIPDPARQAAIGAELFGRSFAKLLPMFKDGKVGLDELRRAAHEAGGVLSEEAVKAADDASDAIKSLELVVAKLAQTIVSQAAPYIKVMADNILALMSASSDASKLVALNEEIAKLEAMTSDTPGSKLRGGRNKINQDRLDALYAERQALIDLAAEKAKQNLGLKPPGEGGGGTTNPLSKSATDLQAKIDFELRLAQVTGLTADAIARTRTEMQARSIAEKAGLEVGTEAYNQAVAKIMKTYDLTQAEKASNEAMEDSIRMTLEMFEAAKKASEAKEKLFQTTTAEIENNYKLIEALKIGTKEYEQELAFIELMNKAKAQNVELTEEEKDQYRQLAKTMGEQRDQMKQIKDKYEDNKRAAQDFAHVIGTAFEDAVLQGKKLGDVLKALEQDIARIILRMTVTKNLENAVTGSNGGGGIGGFLGGLGKIFGGLFGGGGSTGGEGFTASADSGSALASVDYPAFAAGGDPPMGKASMVGENGPELFIPKQPGTIISNDNLKGMGGGTYYIDARGADQAAIMRLEKTIKEVNGSIERRSVNAVIDHKRRNPSSFAA